MSLSFVVVWILATAPSGVTLQLDVRDIIPDSASIRKRAERQQREFERIRWDHLPWTYGSSGRCDLRIGPYCFTFDDDDTWDPPAEHPDVTAAREMLVQTLDSMHTIVPGDDWIVTQLVRYSVEADRHDVAHRAISSCAAVDAWLCPALTGYIHHVQEDFVAAEAAFDLSLAGMSQEQRCAWEDVSDIITGRIRGEWRDRDCAARGGLLDTLFWLADPLYSVPGNELRSEHFARHVASMMFQQARGPDRDRWNRITHQIIMRYGWPTGWERLREYRTSLRPPVVTHYGSDGSATLVPESKLVENVLGIAADDWNTDPDRPHSSHNPPYAREAFRTLDVTSSLFRHGDSTTLVSILSLSDTLVAAGDDIQFAIAVAFDPAASAVWSDTAADTTRVLTATVDAVRRLVSFEALARERGVAARSRFALDFGRLHDPGFQASDVLILERLEDLPTNLSHAIPHIRTPRPYQPGERFVLYWELYDAEPDVTYTTSISLDRTSKGFFRRLVEITPFASHEPAVRVEWDDVTGRSPMVVPRSLAVDLPPELSDGRYRLTLAIHGSSGARVERVVDLTVRTGS